jgi:hypothetical protein
MSYDFRMRATAVGDRALAVHDASLFDTRQKYANLMKSREIIAALPTNVTAV